MKHTVNVSRCQLFAALAAMAWFSIASAGTPTGHLIAVLGKAADASDAPLSTGSIAVRVYSTPSGGSPVYSSGTDFNSTVHDGWFEVVLGATTPLQLDNTVEYYMEIDVDADEIVGDANGGRIAFYPGGGSHARSDLESRLDYLESVFGARTQSPRPHQTMAAVIGGRSQDYQISFGQLGMGTVAGSISSGSLSGVLLFQPVGVFTSANHVLYLGPYYAGTAKSCCVDRVGDANNSGDDEPTLGDISALIDALFISGDPDVLMCLSEADINQSGGTDPTYDDITLGDISILIEYLFIKGPYDPVTNPSGTVLPDCL